MDGFHRYRVMLTSKRINQREHGMLPVVVIDKDLSHRMGSTIRHNRARGTHVVELMTHIVAELTKSGMSDQWIMRNIGMDKDELLRLKQISGLAALFADKDFSIPEPMMRYSYFRPAEVRAVVTRSSSSWKNCFKKRSTSYCTQVFHR